MSEGVGSSVAREGERERERDREREREKVIMYKYSVLFICSLHIYI